jgi:hypothetical protein
MQARTHVGEAAKAAEWDGLRGRRASRSLNPPVRLNPLVTRRLTPRSLALQPAERFTPVDANRSQPGLPTRSCRASGDAQQAKLPVNQPGDALEREADRLADETMLGHPILDASPQLRIGSPAAPPPFLRGYGRPLPAEARAFFEPRWGWDLSTVRVHTDERAAAAAWRVGARAFTLGAHIVFGKGEFAPDTASGRWLLAHELTHVLQQHSGLLRQADGSRGDDMIPESESIDEDVRDGEETFTGEQVVDQVVGARPPAPLVATAGAPAIHEVSPAVPTTVQRVCAKSRAEAGYPVGVNLGIPATPPPDRSRTTAQISALAGDPSNRTAGLTQFQAEWRWNVAISSAGGRSWVTRLAMWFRRPSIRIFLTRGFGRGSCEEADIARHERLHDRDFRENAAEAERSVCDTAATWPAVGRFAARVTPGELMGLIEDWVGFEQWRLSYDNWLDACTWDTLDYPRMYQNCGGAVVAPEADCGDAPERSEPAHVLPLPQKQP